MTVYFSQEVFFTLTLINYIWTKQQRRVTDLEGLAQCV
jgi:hypothetical protein